MFHPPASEGSSRGAVALLALGYLVFVIYGSLVPLDYRGMPLEEALGRFRGIPFLDLGIGSRADWVANLLLFIPLGFLWLGTLWPQRRGIIRIAAALSVLTAATALSIAIEFTQLYFPPRTVSQNDILAEVLGAVVGIQLWWRFGPQVNRWVTLAIRARGKANLAERLLWLYLAGLFLYSVLPLDLTISPVEIYHKWRSGKVNLIPFGFAVADPIQQLYDLVTDALLWAPVTLLWVLSGRRQGMQAWAWTVLAAMALEFCQFFVYSRVSDVTDILMAMLGAALGIWLARFIATPQRVSVESNAALGRPAWAFISALAWSLLLVAIFWYPFDFHLEGSFLRERMSQFERLPFLAYYYGTEFRAVTELLHKILFFLPLGAILAFGRLRMGYSAARTLYSLLSFSLLLCLPAGIELGQVALPQKHPGSTDMILAICGGFLGYFGLLWLHRRA
ncbi:MAG: VanZ family protein [Gammaproteobacteria bacterium]|nr:VanZ family protein [Gammaproteobacteria bacterium]